MRFLAVGAATAAGSALAMFALVQFLHVKPVFAAALVAVAGNLWGFFATRSWTFQVSHGQPSAQFVRYVLVSITAILLSVGVFALLTLFADVHYVLASLMVSAIFALGNFLVHFHWSFAPARPGHTVT